MTVALMLSDGRSYHLPARLELVERRHRRAQREAARKRRGSVRHGKAMRRCRRPRTRAKNIQRHWQDETTTDIARRYRGVVLEALRTRDVTRSARGTLEAPGRGVRQKAGLSRAILEVGWFELERQLGYKMTERGDAVLTVDPRYSSQDCSSCGARDRRSRESQARFRCTTCGHEAHADLNAAINNLARGLSPAQEHGVVTRGRGGAGRPGEPRTSPPR